jgi:hypothetical protein
MLLILMLVISLILSIVFTWIASGNSDNSDNPGWTVGAVLMWMGFIVSVIAVLAIWASCYGENARMIALQKNLSVYQAQYETINQIAVVTPIAQGAMIGGLENAKQSTNASEAYMQYTGMVASLRRSVEGRRVGLSNPWTNWITVPLPVGLENY